MTIKTLNIKAISIDGGTQARVCINNDTVAEYAEVIKDGGKFPAVIVFFDGVDNHLGDGHHRFHGHNAAGKTSIEADVRTGTLRDAILYSLGANAVHGLRPTGADKHKACQTMLADAEWSKLSDREIARHCACSHTLVAQLRNPKVVAILPPATKKPLPATAPAVAILPLAATTVTAACAPAAPAASGNIATAASSRQAEADVTAQAAHGEDDPVALLEASYQETADLRALLAVAEENDQKTATIKWKRISDIAVRRQNELMDTVNAREADLKRLNNWLRRIGVAMDEEDHSKLPAKVEAMARSLKVAA